MDTMRVDEFSLSVYGRSDSEDKYRKAEDLGLAKHSLERLRMEHLPQDLWQRYRLHTWQDKLKFFLPRIAKHFEVDENALLTAWGNRYMPELIPEELNKWRV